jgi:DNA-binding CsgD family transcriptional regulator
VFVPAEDLDGPVGPDEAEAATRRLLVLRALATLAPRQRAAVVLRFYEDLTEPQIADELGCSVGTVKSQLHDAMRRLREIAQAPLAGHRRGRRGVRDDLGRNSDRGPRARRAGDDRPRLPVTRQRLRFSVVVCGCQTFRAGVAGPRCGP